MMWPRIVEVHLACWLAISPFIFGHPPEQVWLWANDLTSATIIMLLAFLSFHERLRKIHLLNAAMGLWLIGVAFVMQTSPPPPALQNHAVIGLLLLIFGILPSPANVPPRAWREMGGETRRTKFE